MESISTLLQGKLFEVKKGRQPSTRDLIIGELFKNVDEEDKKHPFYTDAQGKKKKRRLYTIRGFAVKLSPLSLEELYYLKSVCDDCKSRGGNYSKKLFYEIRPT